MPIIHVTVTKKLPADVKADLMEYFQVTFNIDLKDYYKKYQDNINSDDPFKFLDFMKTIIENDIEKNLEKP